MFEIFCLRTCCYLESIVFTNEQHYTVFIISLHKLQLIGKAVLPTLTTKALPAPTASESTAVPKAKAETVPEPKVEATAEPAKAINSVPSSEDTPKPRPSFSSPYPYVRV